MENIGQVIAAIRKHQGINQSDLAQRCNTTQSHISKIEKGENNPRPNILKSISNELNVPVPIMRFLALQADDLAESKRGLFNDIRPAIMNLIDTLVEVELPKNIGK